MYYNDYELSTEICTIASSISGDICYHYDTTEKAYYNLTINNEVDYTFTLGLYRDYMHSQPPLCDFSCINHITFNETTIVQDMIVLLPLNAEINLHLFLTNVTEQIKIDEQFIIYTKLISASAYSSILLNSFEEDDKTNTIALKKKPNMRLAV